MLASDSEQAKHFADKIVDNFTLHNLVMKNLNQSTYFSKPMYFRILFVIGLIAVATGCILAFSLTAKGKRVFAQQQSTTPITKPKGVPSGEATSVESISNQLIAVQVGSNGRFNMGALPDSTGGSGTNSYDLIYRWPGSPDTSFSTVRVDGTDNIYGSSGTMVESPRDIDAKSNRSKWKIGDIEITQNIQIVNNPQTGREDLGRISYIVKNAGTISHNVGQRIMLDTEIAQNDGVPFRVPSAGIVRTEMEFNGSTIPDTFQAFFDVTRSDRVSTSILKSNVEIVPDRLVLASWPRIAATQFDYTINSNTDFTRDSAYAVYWNPKALASGESRTYTTYYGLAKLDADLQPPLALTVDGPSVLSVVNNHILTESF